MTDTKEEEFDLAREIERDMAEHMPAIFEQYWRGLTHGQYLSLFIRSICRDDTAITPMKGQQTDDN